ncbi:MAG: HutD family protein [Luteibacter sp.]
MTLVPFADLKAVPWKNGLGITREIAVEPSGATMDDFTWRVSIADVDTASPFSVFPAIDRVIVLLSGDGFVMTLDGAQAHALTTPCAPFAFAGEARVEVALAGGATRDFNLMVRRGMAVGSVDVVRGRGPHRFGADTVLVHLASGSALVAGEPMHAGDTAFGAASVTLADDAVALAVRVTPLRG